jgi:hypothetical protein
MPSVAPLIDYAMLADVALFAGGALLLALLSLLAPPERRRGMLPLAIVAAVGLLLMFLLQRFQGDFNQQTLGIMLREATLAVTAFAVVRVATGFVFRCCWPDGTAAHPRRARHRAGAGRLRALPAQCAGRQPGRHRHHVRGRDRSHRVLGPGDAGQSLGQAGALEAHLPDRRLDRVDNIFGGGRHRWRYGARRNDNDRRHPQRLADEEPITVLCRRESSR